VLDHDDRDTELVAHVEDEAGHVLGLLQVHPGHRLVQQEQLGLHRKGAAEFDALLHAVGQLADGESPPLLQLQEVDGVLDRGPVDELTSTRLADPCECRHHPVGVVVVAAEHEVVQHGEIGEQLDVLERAGNAELGDLVRGLADQIGAGEGDTARLRAVHPGQHVEDRGLACAVRADDREQLVAADRERDPVDGPDARERQSHVVEFEHRPVDVLPGALCRRGHDSHRLRRL
jgi:hypothetical protein